MCEAQIKTLMLAFSVLGFGSSPGAACQEAPTTVLVVRRTEKVSEASDAVLSEVGWKRAREVQRVTADAGISVLFASQYARAQQTLEPIADHAGEVVLVSGHSNTVTAIVGALGAPEPPPSKTGTMTTCSSSRSGRDRMPGPCT